MDASSQSNNNQLPGSSLIPASVGAVNGGIGIGAQVPTSGAHGSVPSVQAGQLSQSSGAATESLETSKKRRRVLSQEQIRKRKREMELKDFFVDLKEYGSTVPSEATKFYLQRGGLSTSNDQIVALMSLAADHLIATIVRDCVLCRNLRLQRAGEKDAENFQVGEECGKMLTGEDLAVSLGQRGIDVKDSGTLVRSAGTAAIAASAAAAAVADEDDG